MNPESQVATPDAARSRCSRGVSGQSRSRAPDLSGHVQPADPRAGQRCEPAEHDKQDEQEVNENDDARENARQRHDLRVTTPSETKGFVRRSCPIVDVGPCPGMNCTSSPSGKRRLRIESMSVS